MAREIRHDPELAEERHRLRAAVVAYRDGHRAALGGVRCACPVCPAAWELVEHYVNFCGHAGTPEGRACPGCRYKIESEEPF